MLILERLLFWRQTNHWGIITLNATDFAHLWNVFCRKKILWILHFFLFDTKNEGKMQKPEWMSHFTSEHHAVARQRLFLWARPQNTPERKVLPDDVPPSTDSAAHGGPICWDNTLQSILLPWKFYYHRSPNCVLHLALDARPVIRLLYGLGQSPVNYELQSNLDLKERKQKSIKNA